MEPEVLRGEFDTLLLDNSGGQEGKRSGIEWSGEEKSGDFV